MSKESNILKTMGTNVLKRINYIFLAVFLFEAVHFLYILLAQRLVVHDSFYRFSIQYYFLNNYFQSGQIPQWMPHLTHGTTAYWWHALQGITGLFFYGITVLGDLFKGVPYFFVFNFGLLIDKFILLVGAWLLSKRLFKSDYAPYFVCLSLVASSLWGSQVFFNFHFYYAMPLIMYLGHRFLDTGQWRYCVAAINLYILQIFGNAAYFLPVTSFALVIYFGAHIVCHWADFFRTIKALRFRWEFLISVLGIVLSAIIAYIFLKQGLHDELVRYLPGRSGDTSIPLQKLAYYGKKGTWGKWIELFLGFSVNRDYSFYIGLTGVWLSITATFVIFRKKALPIAFVILMLMLLSKNTLVTKYLYESWPLMKFYRHLYLILPFVRFWMCLFAGFGLDYLLHKQENCIKRTLFWSVIFFAAMTVLMVLISADVSKMVQVDKLMGFGRLEQSIATGTANIEKVAQLFRTAAVRNGIFAVLLGGGILLLRRKGKIALIVFLGLIHMVDMGQYAYQETQRKTLSLNATQYDLLAYQPIPFRLRRTKTLFIDLVRHRFLNKPLLSSSAHYWTLNAFLFNDQAGTSTRTDHWLKPYDEYMRTMWGDRPGDDLKTPHWKEDKYFSVLFPFDNITATNISGITQDKIVFYKNGYWLENGKNLVNLMQDKKFAGNKLFVTEKTVVAPGSKNRLSIWDSQVSLEEDDRINLPYTVRQFDSNQLIIDVENPSQNPVWMFYSDGWHSRWRAWINNVPVAVLRAQMAYKAVELKPGKNHIKLLYYSSWFAGLTRLIGLNCLIWIAWICWMIIRLNQKSSNVKQGVLR